MSVKAKLLSAILIIFVVIWGLFFIGQAGFMVLSGLRAYVGAEGLWVKGQREATYQLIQYIFTEEETRYQSFLEGLKVPLGDKTARLELEKAFPADDIIFQGFADASNHPDDIPSMIFLYKNFKNVYYIRNAIEQWEIADKLIDELTKVGEETHRYITSNRMSQEKSALTLLSVDDLQKKLNEAEKLFSYNMSAAARWTANLLFVTMLIFTVAGSIICFVMFRLIAGIIFDLNDKNIQLRAQADRESSIRKKLKESEERFRRIAENAPDMIYRMALPEGHYEYVSPASNMIFGYSPDEFYQQPNLIQKIIHPDWLDYFAEQWKRLQDGKMPPTYEYQIVNKAGEKRWINQRNVLICDNEGAPIAIEGIATDITVQKEWEHEKELMALDLRQAHKMEAIGTLAGGIAHDFNNILSIILGYTDMTKNDIPDGSPAKFHLEEVLKAANRAKELVKQILSFSRKEIQERVPVQLHTIVNEVLQMIRASLPSTIDIHQNIDSTCGSILAEPTHIHQVLMNICTNAAHAMDKDGGVLEVTLECCELSEEALGSGIDSGLYLKLTVKDTGTGIAPDLHERIFDPYFTTKEVDKGSGMGLAVVAGIVKSHDGFIRVESQPGKGSVFTIYFPQIEQQFRLDVEDSDSFATGKEHILVVDDEKHLSDLMKLRLEHLGYQVTPMTSSLKALEFFRCQPESIDLVISDQTMPGLTGEQLAKKLMAIRAEIPIIICTGYSAKIDAEKASFLGIRAFIMKPVTLPELARTIRQVLDDKELT